MDTLDLSRPYSVMDHHLCKFMQDGKKFDAKGELLEAPSSGIDELDSAVKETLANKRAKKAAAELAAKEAADKAAAELAAKEAADKAAAELAAAELAAKEAADKEAADKEAADKEAADKAATELAAKEQPPVVVVTPEDDHELA